MTPERWQRVEAVLDHVLDAAPADRPALLDRYCADDPDLRAQVEALLQAHDAAEEYLETPADRFAAPYLNLAPLPSAAPAPEQRIGPYRVVREIGRGGMGVVVLAERADGHFEQQVALKLIRRGMDSDRIVRRFLRERQILARLQHPHIARLLDGGVTDDGLPYLAMEYVDGQPLTDYCAVRRLPLEARLHLFMTACRAVQYAHRNLVIHRDLKPSNILVAEDTEGRPQVKLLDFGIAKLLHDAGSGAPTHSPTLATRTGFVAMTPEYAAPEQVQGEAVTTATDVYGLGVVLYELLAGRRPYRFERRTPSEIERVICDVDPVPPSTALASDEDSGTRTRTERPASRRALQGDLDTICLKALRKEPERRYATADALADDLHRFLTTHPIQARPDTVGYRLGKFIHRHRPQVVAATAAAVLLLGVSLLYAINLNRALDRAQRETARASEIHTFLTDLFLVNAPDSSAGAVITARELLDRGTARISADLTGQPDLRASMLEVLSEAYNNLHLTDPAEQLTREALAIRQSTPGVLPEDLASTLALAGSVHLKQHRLEEAARLFQDALDLLRQHVEPPHPLMAHCIAELALITKYQGDYEAAVARYREAVAMYRALGGEHRSKAATTRSNMGMALLDWGRIDEAADVLEAALPAIRATEGDTSRWTSSTLHFLGLARKRQGDLVAAESLYTEALALRRVLYGDAHPHTATTLANLAVVLKDLERYDEAEPLYREALATQRATMGPQHERVGISINNLGKFLYVKGDYAAAARHYGEALAIFRAHYGDEHPFVGAVLNNVGALQQAQGRLEAARHTYETALAIHRATLAEQHPRLGSALLGLGRVLLARGMPDAARPYLEEAVALFQARYGADHDQTRAARTALAGAQSASSTTVARR
jgi:serine/threonine-protein kinase